jgi:hypothetical protein
MRKAALFFFLSLLAACGQVRHAGQEAGPDWGALPPHEISARFVPGGLANVIVVSVTDWRPLRRALLVSPDGTRVPAYSLDVEASPVQDGPIPAGNAPSLGLSQSVTRSGDVVSTGLIQLPNPAVYAKTWQQWHIEVAIGDGGNRHEMTLPAPPSPPA